MSRCLKHFLEREQLDESEMWYCSSCKVGQGWTGKQTPREARTLPRLGLAFGREITNLSIFGFVVFFVDGVDSSTHVLGPAPKYFWHFFYVKETAVPGATLPAAVPLFIRGLLLPRTTFLLSLNCLPPPSSSSSRSLPPPQEHRRAYKELSLWRLPPVLIIHLKRFSYDTNGGWAASREKIDSFVTFPVK